jgi:uncharacterized membrane protein YgcG
VPSWWIRLVNCGTYDNGLEEITLSLRCVSSGSSCGRSSCRRVALRSSWSWGGVPTGGGGCSVV